MMTYFNPKSCRGQAFAPIFSGKIDHLCRECNAALICAQNPRNPIFYVGAKHIAYPTGSRFASTAWRKLTAPTSSGKIDHLCRECNAALMGVGGFRNRVSGLVAGA